MASAEAAVAGGCGVALSVRHHSQRLLHAALPGTSVDKNGWLERKCAVVGVLSKFLGVEL